MFKVSSRVLQNICFTKFAFLLTHGIYEFLKLYDICYVWKGSYWKILALGAFRYGPHISSISVSSHQLGFSQLFQCFNNNSGWRRRGVMWFWSDARRLGAWTGPANARPVGLLLETVTSVGIQLRSGMYWQNWLARRVISTCSAMEQTHCCLRVYREIYYTVKWGILINHYILIIID